MLLVAVVATLSFWNSLGGGFVWDDHDLIVEDRRLRSWDQVGEIFAQDFFAEDQVVDERGYGYYRPLTTLSYLIDYQLGGEAPFHFHVTNLALHAGCAVLVLLLLSQLLGQLELSTRAATVAALLFAVHPIHTESVAWIAGRTDVLAFLLCVGSLVVHGGRGRTDSAIARPARSSRENGWTVSGRVALAVALYLAALLAKEMSVVLLAWLVIRLWIVDRLPPLVLLRRLAPFLAATFAYGVWRFWVVEVQIPGAPPEHSLTAALLSAGPTLVRYLGWLLLPLEPSAYVQNPYASGIADPRVIGSWVLLAVLAGVVWRSRDRALWLFGAMLVASFGPVLNLVRVAAPADMGNVMAERFCYFPSLPFVALLVRAAILVGSRSRAPSWSRRVGWASVVVLCALGLLACWQRNRAWRDELGFFEHTLAQAPDAPLLWSRLASVQLERGDYEAAERALDAADRLYPAPDASARASLALAEGDLAGALSLQEARARVATFGRARAYNNLAYLYIRTGKLERAREILEELIEADLDYALVHANLAGIYSLMDREEDARQHYSVALAERPDDLAIAQGWAELEHRLGNLAAVADIYQGQIRFHPENVRLLNNLAAVRQEQGDLDRALELYQRIAKLDPTYWLARLNEAQATIESGRVEEARAMLRDLLDRAEEPEILERGRELLAIADQASVGPRGEGR